MRLEITSNHHHPEVGDIAARVASEVHGEAGLPLAVAISSRTVLTARACSDLLADEVERRRAELARLRALAPSEPTS